MGVRVAAKTIIACSCLAIIAVISGLIINGSMVAKIHTRSTEHRRQIADQNSG